MCWYLTKKMYIIVDIVKLSLRRILKVTQHFWKKFPVKAVLLRLYALFRERRYLDCSAHMTSQTPAIGWLCCFDWQRKDSNAESMASFALLLHSVNCFGIWGIIVDCFPVTALPVMFYSGCITSFNFLNIAIYNSIKPWDFSQFQVIIVHLSIVQFWVSFWQLIKWKQILLVCSDLRVIVQPCYICVDIWC